MALYLIARLRALITPIKLSPPCDNPDLTYGIGARVGKTPVRMVFPYGSDKDAVVDVLRDKIHCMTGKLYTRRCLARRMPALIATPAPPTVTAGDLHEACREYQRRTGRTAIIIRHHPPHLAIAAWKKDYTRVVAATITPDTSVGLHDALEQLIAATT